MIEFVRSTVARTIECLPNVRRPTILGSTCNIHRICNIFPFLVFNLTSNNFYTLLYQYHTENGYDRSFFRNLFSDTFFTLNGHCCHMATKCLKINISKRIMISVLFLMSLSTSNRKVCQQVMIYNFLLQLNKHGFAKYVKFCKKTHLFNDLVSTRNGLKCETTI